MSNALKKRKKKMQPLGYTDAELNGMRKYSQMQSRMNSTTRTAYFNVRLISYQVLHDRFGFGHKRIVRLENTVDKYLEKCADRNMRGTAMGAFLLEKCKIDVQSEVNKIPYRERVLLVCDRFPTNTTVAMETGKIVAAAIYNYFAFSSVALKTVFKFSKNQISQYLYYIRDLVNSVARQYEDMVGFASVLYQECKYCDSRFIGKFYKV